MYKIVECMIEASRDSPLEIINYNYARIPFSKNEVDEIKKKGVDLPKEVANALNAIAKELKEAYSVDISAEVTGEGGTVVFIKGAGQLYTNNPDAFVSLARIRDRVVKELVPDATDRDPSMAARSTTPAQPVPASTPVDTSKPPSIKIAKPLKMPAKVPAQPSPIMKDIDKPPAQPTKPVAAKPISARPDKPAPAKLPEMPRSGEGFALMLERINEKTLVERVELVRLLVDKIKINESAAGSMIDSFLSSNADFMEDVGFIFKKK